MSESSWPQERVWPLQKLLIQFDRRPLWHVHTFARRCIHPLKSQSDLSDSAENSQDLLAVPLELCRPNAGDL